MRREPSAVSSHDSELLTFVRLAPLCAHSLTRSARRRVQPYVLVTKRRSIRLPSDMLVGHISSAIAR